MASPTHHGLLVTRLLVLLSSWLILVSLSTTAAITISSAPTHISPTTAYGPYFRCVLQSNDVGCSLSRWSVNGSTLIPSGKYQIGPAPGGGFGLQVHNIAESDAGVYSCEFTCNGGEIKSASYHLIYYHDIVIHTADNIVYHVYLHDNVTLLCDADHVTVREWYYSNNSIVKLGGKFNKQGSSLVVQNVTPLEAIGYGCLVRNPAVSPRAIFNTVRVYAPPNITLSGPQSVDEGLSVVIHCSSYGIPKPTITWIRGSDVIVPGGRIEQTYGESGYHVSSSLTINQLHQSDNGDYRCSVANTNGTMFSVTNVTVNVPPQPFIDVLPIKIYSTNVTISLVVVLLNISNVDTNVTVSWRPTSSAMDEGSIILPSNESSSFVLYNLSPGTSYTVMASVLTASPLMLTDSAVFTTLSDTIVSPNLTLSSSLPHTPVLTSSITTTNGPITTQPLSEGIMFAIVGGGVLVVLMVMVMVTVIVMVCLLRSRRSKSKGINRFDSSRSDASLMYHKQNSSTSNVSAVSSDSLIARSFTPNSLGPNVVQVVQQPTAVYMPPHIMYHQENNFEMTDNVAFSDARPTFLLGGDPGSLSETASELHDPADELQFEYTTNTNYEGHTPFALRRDNPRFEIVSEGRHGDGRRRDVFETVKIKN